MRLAAGLLVLALSFEARCGIVSPGWGDELTGRWGGTHIALWLGESGGTVEYDCAHGTIAPLWVDGSGRFDVSGTYVREHGGPERPGEALEPVPARYVGRVSGHSMVLRVFVGSETLGPFELGRERPPQLYECL